MWKIRRKKLHFLHLTFSWRQSKNLQTDWYICTRMFMKEEKDWEAQKLHFPHSKFFEHKIADCPAECENLQVGWFQVQDLKRRNKNYSKYSNPQIGPKCFWFHVAFPPNSEMLHAATVFVPNVWHIPQSPSPPCLAVGDPCWPFFAEAIFTSIQAHHTLGIFKFACWLHSKQMQQLFENKFCNSRKERIWRGGGLYVLCSSSLWPSSWPLFDAHCNQCTALQWCFSEVIKPT